MALSGSSLSVAEGNVGTTILPLCVQLQDIMTGLDRSVPLLLNTMFGTAGTFILLHYAGLTMLAQLSCI